MRHSRLMMRRIEDRIMALSLRLVAARDPARVEVLSAQLRDAIAEHVRRLRNKVLGAAQTPERRRLP